MKLTHALAIFALLPLAACQNDAADTKATEANSEQSTEINADVSDAANQPSAPVMATDPVIEATNGAHRDDAARARDAHRHPAETLAFFGLQADQTVVELLPGGGWYTDVIAPVVAENGKYYGASYATDIEGQPDYRPRLTKAFTKKIEQGRDLYGQAEVTILAPPQYVDIAPAGSADLVVSFRNFHGWLREDPALYLDTVVTALKPGGVFGIVQHRGAEGTDVELMKTSGYVSEAIVIKYAEAAGLVLEARSEINANPNDTADWEKGVWTLPPTLARGEEDKEKYLAIGESDRMTLKFRKPDA